MRTIYINCENGVSGDMVLNALADLAEDPSAVRNNIERIAAVVKEKGSGAHGHEELGIHSHGHDHSHGHHDHDHEHAHHEHAHHDHAHAHEHAHHTHDHAHSHEHSHGHSHGGHDQHHRSYRQVMEIISGMPVSSRVKQTAEQIYAVIARAESAVHGDPLDTLHFHEVGRDQAIANVLGLAVCMDALRPERVFVSEVCDGHGTVKCAHGVLNVPVPAVKAMLDDCDLAYKQTEHEGEMVTPSGLAMIIGIGAKTGPKPEGTPVRTSEAKGARSFTEHGLVAELYE